MVKHAIHAGRPNTTAWHRIPAPGTQSNSGAALKHARFPIPIMLGIEQEDAEMTF